MKSKKNQIKNHFFDFLFDILFIINIIIYIIYFITLLYYDNDLMSNFLINIKEIYNIPYSIDLELFKEYNIQNNTLYSDIENLVIELEDQLNELLLIIYNNWFFGTKYLTFEKQTMETKLLLGLLLSFNI